MDLTTVKNKGLKKLKPPVPRISVGMGTCGIGNGARTLYTALEEYSRKEKKNLLLTQTGCFGFCSEEPFINVLLPGKPILILHKLTAEEMPVLVQAALNGDMKHVENHALCKITEWDHHTSALQYGEGYPGIPSWNEIPFFKWQKKIVLRNCGIINPEDIEEYIAVGGYDTFRQVLDRGNPGEVIEQLKISKLRGRGGAGFPTWKKWDIMRSARGNVKYIVCNADEGDPGAYMNRNELESDPHMIIEGMLLGAFAMGTREGIVYIRAEYPLAVRRIKKAIAQAGEAGLLGKNILGSGFEFHIHIVEGAGAFVCGEETALIASIEGNAGKPKPRPPYPAQRGLWGKPTNINNVETWTNIPVIMARGGEWFTQTGTKESAGTKVFSLVGKIKNTGLVELPLGESIETLVFKIGGGCEHNKKIKAVQTGGPSGGCIPHHLFHTPVDYESLTALGSIMGSGGLVVMDEDNCMVDVARFFLEFTTSESCGKCVPCREGLFQALGVLKKISAGNSTEEDLKQLKEMGLIIKDTALCGLGQTGPNPVLTTLQYFYNEYREHFLDKRCGAGVCGQLYLSPCENSCPLHMNIPKFIALYQEGRLKEAFLSIIMDNPLPASTGRVCHHPCENRCRRADIDQPVGMREIHRFIADTVYSRNLDREIFQQLYSARLAPTGKKIAIIGAGPAGLTASFYLALLGHDVTVHEVHSELGGMLRYAIPGYRLPDSVLNREIENIASLGIRFIQETSVDSPEKIKKLEKEFDAVFIAMGTRKDISLKIQGETLDGVYSSIDLLHSISLKKKVQSGKQVVVIGGGNAAIDTARSITRLGSRAQIVYRREERDMPAMEDEIREAHNEGVRFTFLAGPVKILGDGKGKVRGIEVVEMKPGDYDSSGRRIPVPTDNQYTIDCDAVVLAIGEKADSAFLSKYGIKLKTSGLVLADDYTLQTNNNNVFAGGDIVTGPATVTQAMAAGKRFARVIDKKLTCDDRMGLIEKVIPFSQDAPQLPQGGDRQKMKKLPVKKRLDNFDEVDCGLPEKAAETEALRCLRCDVKEI